MNLNRTTISKIIKTYQETGMYEKKKRMNFRTRKLFLKIKTHKTWIDADCTMSLRTISKRCLDELIITVSKSTIEKLINEFSYS
jgi:transposase